MKKYLLFFSLILLQTAAFAYQSGDKTLGISLNTAIPCLGSDWGEFNVVNVTTGVEHDAKLGDPSLGFNIHGFYFLSQRIALGLSFGYDYFPTDRASGLELNVNTQSLHYMLLSRIYLNPQNSLQFYLPLGLGIANTRTSIEMEKTEHFQDTNWAASIGLGMEYMVSAHIGLNAEARYNYNRFKTSKFTAQQEYVKLFPQASYISYSAGLFYKF